MNNLSIEISNLNKIYKSALGEEKRALDDLNLNVPKGSIFGLLGPNGAGKSTLINILAGTVNKSFGKVKIANVDIDNFPKKARYMIGVVPQEIVVDTFFPIEQALEFYAGYYGIRPKDRRTHQILKALSLYEKRYNMPQQLSGGMKRRFLVAKAMVHSPEVLILDEPTAGVDIELREQLWNFVKEQNSLGTTIILTTHYLAEAQNLCDHIAFINHGKIIKNDSKDRLLNDLGSRFLDVEFDRPVDGNFITIEDARYQIISENKLRFSVDIEKNNFDEILKLISECKVKVKDLKVIQPDLEDIFHKIIK